MSTTQKALSLSEALYEEYRFRLSALTITKSFDSDGSPYISIGSGTPGEANAIVKTAPLPWTTAKDIFGNSANQYTPHVIQIVTETNYASTSDNIADALTTAQLLAVLAPALMKGCKLEWYQSSYGDSPDLDDITAAKLKATYETSLQHPLTTSS